MDLTTNARETGIADGKAGRPFARSSCQCLSCQAYADGYAAGTAERLRAMDPTATAGEDEDGGAGQTPA